MTTTSFPADSVKQFPGTAFDAVIGDMSILMKTNRYYTDNSLLQTGNTYTVTAEWGRTAVERGWATDVGGVLPFTPQPVALTPVYVGTWAGRPAASAVAVGAEIIITDWPSSLRGRLYSDGTYWRPLNGRVLLRQLPASVDMSPTGNSLQVLDTFDIPSGLWFPGAELEIYLGAEKFSGTADTGTIRVKINGQIGLTLTLSTTVISLGTTQRIQRISGTSVRKSGAGGSGATGPLASTSTTARAAALTVADMDANATTIELSGQMTTGGGTEYCSVHLFAVHLCG